MTSMRLKLNLRGLSLEYDAYTFGGINWGLRLPSANIAHLITLDDRLGLNANTHVVEVSIGSNAATGTKSLLWTDKYIYPLFVKPKLVIDGMIFAQFEYGIINTTATSGLGMINEIQCKLKKIDENGNETTLGGQDIIPGWSVTLSGNTLIQASFPFFFSVPTQIITIEERILVETKIYGLETSDAGITLFYRISHLNTDEQSMIIPIV